MMSIASSQRRAPAKGVPDEPRGFRKPVEPRTAHVLLIEDNPGDAVIATRHLRAAAWTSFQITTTKTVADALRILQTITPDVVLTDLGLPDAEGIEAVLRLRSSHEAVPIVVLTGTRDHQTGAAAIRAGADDYLPKSGLDPEILGRTVQYAIERRKTARALVSHIREGVLVVSEDNTVRFANPAAADMLACAEVTLVGRPCPIANMVDGAEVEMRQDTHDPMLVELSCASIHWYGQPATLWTLHDMSATHRIEALSKQLEQSSRLAAMGQLAASVAHELNNALAVVQLNLPMLTQLVRTARSANPNSPELVEIAQIVDENTRAVSHMARTSEDLQRFTRKRERSTQVCDVNSVVHDTVRLVGKRIHHRAQLAVELGPPTTIACDPTRLSQVLLNLLLNAADAVDHLPATEARVSVTTSCSHDEVWIEVADNGVGIPEANLPNIFDAFFTTKDADSGTGLGLSVAADIVRDHDGAISATSDESGTRLHVRLPRTRRGRGRTRPVPDIGIQAQASTARILLIDDDALVRRALQRSLPYEVVAVGSGQEAMECLERGDRFDAIVCDLMMPEMDGAAVFDRIQELDPALGERVLFVSGGAVSKRARDLLARDETRLLHKPITPQVLQATLARMLAKEAD